MSDDQFKQDVDSFVSDVATETAKISIDGLADKAQTKADAYDKLAAKVSADLEVTQRLAEKYQSKAELEGDPGRAEYFKKIGNQLEERLSDQQGKTSEAWLKSNFLERTSDGLKYAGLIGDGVDIGKMISAVDSGDYDELGRVSSGILGGIVATVMLGAFLATLPVSGTVAAIVSAIAYISASIFGGMAGEWWWDNHVSGSVNSDFLSALNFTPRSDPLALDLDGDGIETISANTGITFDFDGDGLKTGTGWIKGEDGLLVLDRNGNGRIDSGAELFGVDTLKTNGQKAKDGFDALRDLDSNDDGVFDAQDEQFANMRVWQDLNQDGIAQAHELKSLAEHAIVAINLNSTASNTTANGNRVSAVGTFVRGDGSQGQAANLDLASNPFYREYGDRLALSEQ